MTKKPWTIEEDDFIRDCAREGRTRQQCADGLNRSLDSMRQRAAVLGISFDRAVINPEVRDVVVNLHLQGLTYGQIALQTKLSRGTIGGHLARWNAAGKPTPRPASATFLLAALDDNRPRQTHFNRELECEIVHRERDKRFVRELAKAFVRGDHLPAGVPKPLVLVG